MYCIFISKDVVFGFQVFPACLPSSPSSFLLFIYLLGGGRGGKYDYRAEHCIAVFQSTAITVWHM